MRRLKLNHLAIIPHIPTNKPSSAERDESWNTAEAVLQMNATGAIGLFDRFAQVRQVLGGDSFFFFFPLGEGSKLYFHTGKRLFLWWIAAEYKMET